MKEKLIDVLYKITIGIFVLAVIISGIWIIADNSIDSTSLLDGIRLVLIIPSILISPVIILVALINRIFFDKTNSSNLYKTIIINIIYILNFAFMPDLFKGLML